MVQAEPATPRHRRDTALLDEVHERRCASYAERSPTGTAFEHVHAEHALVVLDRALEIAASASEPRRRESAPADAVAQQLD